METGQSFREIIEEWEPEDILTVLYYLDDKADAARDARGGRRG